MQVNSGKMTAIVATAVVVTAVRNDLKSLCGSVGSQ